jgi:hypothetical protein
MIVDQHHIVISHRLDIWNRLHTTTRSPPHHGCTPSSLKLVPLRLPPCRPRTPSSARACIPTHPATPTDTGVPPQCQPTTRRTRSDTCITGRSLGWTAQSCTKEEDESHEEATPTDGWQGSEGCYCFEQMQRVRKAKESAYSVSLLRAK